MKRLILLIATFITVFALSACGDICVGPTCITGEVTETNDAILPYTHINGEGVETDMDGYILFEAEVLGYVKYQVAYLSCTCRPAVVNYSNVMYIEIDTTNNAIKYISFDTDGEDGHYLPGTWGDSSGAIEQNEVTYEMFVDDFFPWLVGKTYADLEGISVFTNLSYHDKITNTTQIAETDLIDEFGGSSVSTNNMIRIVKELLLYHEANYAD